MVHLSKEQKEQVAIELCTREGSAQEIADKYNVSRYSVYNWAWDLLGKGNVSPMPKKKRSTTAAGQEDVEALKQEIEQLHSEAEELQRHIKTLNGYNRKGIRYEGGIVIPGSGTWYYNSNDHYSFSESNKDGWEIMTNIFRV